jgi:hypothetical protein
MTHQLETTNAALDERLKIVGGILQSVGISAVIWGSDALVYRGVTTLKIVFFKRYRCN